MKIGVYIMHQAKTPAKRTDIIWQTFEILLVNVHRFRHFTGTCLTNSVCLQNWHSKRASQAMFVLVAKSTSKQRLSVKPQSNGQTLFGKHLKFCLSSTTFVGLATKQTRPGQTFFACDIDKQSVLVVWPKVQVLEIYCFPERSSAKNYCS